MRVGHLGKVEAVDEGGDLPRGKGEVHHGLLTDQSAFVGSSKNLKDLKGRLKSGSSPL